MDSETLRHACERAGLETRPAINTPWYARDGRGSSWTSDDPALPAYVAGRLVETLRIGYGPAWTWYVEVLNRIAGPVPLHATDEQRIAAALEALDDR